MVPKKDKSWRLCVDFKDLNKATLATNPILAAPNIGEPMLLYIAATRQVVTAVLAVE